MAERPPQPGDPKRPTLDQVLDRADAATSDAVRRLIDKNPEARRHADIQARIDDSLRRAFAEPEFTIARPEPLPLSRRPMPWRLWAAAAVVLLSALAGWRFWVVSNRPDVLGPLYRTTVAAGFVPEVVCTTDEEFAGWCRAYLRQPIYVKSRPADIQYVGWNKGNIISPISGILLVRVGGEPVLVVLERTDRQKVVPGRIRDAGLKVFSRRIGEAVLYEVTPKADAAILPNLSASPRP